MKNNEKKQKIVDTIVGSETIIEGKITLPTSLRIDGKVYGEVDCKGDVSIGKDGYAEPAIKAKNIFIAGEVKGDLHTSEKVHVQPSGKLSGSATTKGLIIEDGGMFNGESTIVEEGDSKGKKKPAKASKDEEAV